MMMKWTLPCAAVVVVGFMADPVPAQEPAKIPATVVTTSPPVITTPSPGLFGRLRDRRGTTTSYYPQIVQAQATTTEAKSGVLQVQNTETVGAPAPMQVTPAPTQVMETRAGLLSRLRGRLGR
jgi:hypothetical protein